MRPFCATLARAMGTTFFPFIEFDDSRRSSPELPPFSHPEPEVLDLTDFVPLTHAKDYRFYAAIAGVRSSPDRPPRFKPRGLPPHCSSLVSRKVADFFDPDDPSIGWLFQDEIIVAMQAANLDEDALSPELAMLMDMLRSLERTLGFRRARLVFAFS